MINNLSSSVREFPRDEYRKFAPLARDTRAH